MTLYQKFHKAFNQSKNSGLNKIVKFEHSGCIYGIQYTGDHQRDRVLVCRHFIGADAGYSLISTCNFSKAVFEIMIDSFWHRSHNLKEFFSMSKSFRRLNHLYKIRERWIGGKCFMLRGSTEYTWIKNRLPWEAKHHIFNGLIY